MFNVNIEDDRLKEELKGINLYVYSRTPLASVHFGVERSSSDVKAYLKPIPLDSLTEELPYSVGTEKPEAPGARASNRYYVARIRVADFKGTYGLKEIARITRTKTFLEAAIVPFTLYDVILTVDDIVGYFDIMANGQVHYRNYIEFNHNENTEFINNTRVTRG